MIVKKEKWFLIGGAIVLAFILATLSILYSVKRSGTSSVTPYPLPGMYFVKDAPVPPDFPAGLILDNNAPISVAFFTPKDAPGQELSNIPSGTAKMIEETSQQEIVRWLSNDSIASLIDSYKKYFSDNGWVAVDDGAPSPNIHRLHGTFASFTVAISLSSQASGTLVTVSYSEKKN